jgi:transposase
MLEVLMLFVGDDWAEDHHDVEVVDETGTVLARRRFPEGLVGVTALHALIAEHAPPQWAELDPAEAARQVKVGIETERGSWVAALTAAGYQVFAINPLSVSRYRQRHSTSGAKSDAADAHLLAEIVRLDRAHHLPVAGDSPLGEAIKLTARTHQSMVWDRTRHVLRLRSALREFFPAALAAFAELDAPDVLELLAAAPDPDTASRLSKSRVLTAFKRAGRRGNLEARADQLRRRLRAEELRQPPMVQDAYAAIVASEVALVEALNGQIEKLGEVVGHHFGRHPDAEIYASQPGLGVVPAARVLGEFGDDPDRYVSGKARKNYAGTSPLTRASGKKKVVAARFIRNDRLIDALMAQALSALGASPGARALYDAERARGTEHNAALRKLASRLVGILHGCLKTRTLYDDATAWPHRKTPQSDIAA